MRSLRELQQAFADAVLAPTGIAPAFATTGRATPAERIDIYRRAVRANYRNALSATYPVVQRLVGNPFFRAAADAFALACPSRGGDLNVYGGEFGDFLASYAPAAGLPYLPDVARLEWALDEANRAPDMACVPEFVLAALASIAPHRLPTMRVRLHPSCRFVASDYAILRIWQVHQPEHDGDDRVQFDESADRLLVHRDARGTAIERTPAGDFAWLAALASGAMLAEAIEAAQRADAAFDLGEALRTHIGGRIVAGTVADR
jgi:hypothetical protein